MTKIKLPKWLRTTLCICVALGVLGVCAVGVINAYMKLSVKDVLLTQEEAAALQNVDCILVLGCGVGKSGKPTPMLEDRLQRGIALYNDGAAPKLLMTGDHGREGYNEVGVMKRVAVEAGVPSEDIFMDHAGFSTYESMYRARDIFCAKKVIIVTQQYHLYRAVYIARSLGLDAYGVNCDYRTHGDQFFRDVREILARVKDFATSIIQPKPTYLGDAIPISGNGELTHDDSYNNIG